MLALRGREWKWLRKSDRTREWEWQNSSSVFKLHVLIVNEVNMILQDQNICSPFLSHWSGMSLKAWFSEFKASGLRPEEQKYFKLTFLFSGDCFRPRDYSLVIHEIYFALALASTKLCINNSFLTESHSHSFQCNHFYELQLYYIICLSDLCICSTSQNEG